MISQNSAALASDISSRLHNLGATVSPETVKTAIDTAKWAVNETYRLVEAVAGQLYKMYMGGSEVPKTAINERKAEAVAVKPQLTSVAKPEEAPEPEEEFFDPEWDGFLDSDYKDALDTLDTPKTLVQEKAKNTMEDSLPASRKVARADSSKHAFGTHLPRPIRREKGMTDAEYRNKVESNLRAVEDPFKPKKTGKARFSSRVEELAKPKVRNADKHISHHQAELNWRKSLRK